MGDGFNRAEPQWCRKRLFVIEKLHRFITLVQHPLSVHKELAAPHSRLNRPGGTLQQQLSYRGFQTRNTFRNRG